MAYTWTQELATGVESIDDQHKQLFKAINDLLEACFSGTGHTKLDSTVQFLIDYTEKHFSDEEKLQQQYNYPKYPHHKKLHDAFDRTVREIADQLKKEGANAALLRKVNSSIGDWLVNHIKDEDKLFAAHIRESGK